MKTILFICVLPGILLAADFPDNFDSYTPGDDLDQSAAWFRYDPGGNLFVADDGGNNIVESLWNSYDYIVYTCFGSLIWSNGAVSADIKFNGSESTFGFMSRMNTSTGECYVGGIYPVYPPVGATVIGYVNENGDYTTLAEDYFYPLNEDIWYNVSFEVTGNNPVTLRVSVNGTVNSDVQDSVYDLGAGMAGLGGGYENTEPMFYVDNFNVDDYSTALSRISFGAIKAIFQ